MSKRWKMSRSRSRRDFRKKAQRIHPKNGMRGGPVMRGGIRL